MAISLSKMKTRQAKSEALRQLDKQAKKAAEGETKRKKKAGFWGTLGGAALGIGLTGALGLTGGLAAPLVMGVASSLGKKWADDASKKGMFKTKGQVDTITSGLTEKYGFGSAQAADVQEELDKSRKSTWSPESMLQDVAMSYVTAGIGGKLTPGMKTLTSGGKGSFLKALGGAEGAVGGTKGIQQALFGIDSIKGDVPEALSENIELASMPEGFGDISPKAPSRLEPVDFNLADDTMEVSNIPFVDQQTDDYSWIQGFAQGGQVPQMDEHTLIGLRLLSEMAKGQTAYDGTPLEEEEEQQLTISDMFASQGKTLGGNNTQSLSQMMGK